MKKISILLPYKENFSPRYAGAVSLLVNDTVLSSKYKNNTTVYGSTDFKEKFYANYKNEGIGEFKIFNNRLFKNKKTYHSF